MFLLEPGRIGAMSQASGLSFTSELPVKTESYECQLQGCADYQFPGPRPSVGNPLQPNTQEMVSGYPLADTPMSMLGLSSDDLGFVNFDPPMQNTLTGGISSADAFPMNFNIPPSMESPQSTEDTDSVNIPLQHPPSQLPPQLQLSIRSQLHPPYPIPFPPNRQYVRFDRIRRNSAPELSAHEIERRVKQAHRRASHNVVEKRYRVNLNSKFKKLDEVVLHGTRLNFDAENGNSEGSSDLPMQARRTQPPKAAIIDSALVYIQTLQREVGELKRRLAIYESRVPSLRGHPADMGVRAPGPGNATGHAQSFIHGHPSRENDALET
ncbi:hypothetical protein BJX63DRAFT_414780 [Aspergillus granulosus]|uniref:BHLH domain-containing protein n=1 Tax=Aspergillus granulosus TaxID=176169 RepID=A0ABR4GU27_9EURO